MSKMKTYRKTAITAPENLLSTQCLGMPLTILPPEKISALVPPSLPFFPLLFLSSTVSHSYSLPLFCPIWPPHPLNSRGGQKIIYKTNKKQLSSLSGGGSKLMLHSLWGRHWLNSMLHLWQIRHFNQMKNGLITGNMYFIKFLKSYLAET